MSATTASASGTDSRRRADKRILTIFSAFAILSVIAPIALYPLYPAATTADVISRIFGGITLSLMLAGFSSYLNYRKSGLMSRRWLLKQFVLVSFFTALLFSLVLILAIAVYPDEFEMPDVTSEPLDQHMPLVFVSLLAGQTLIFFLMLPLLLILGFGIVGVMAAVERRLTPYVLKTIQELGRKKGLSVMDRGMRWLFAIPEVLDVRTLSFDPQPPRTGFKAVDMRWPVGWQMFFGAILAVYVSFNPFISNSSADDILAIFSVLTAAAIVIPFLILSWFIYLRIGARIQGQARDFTLFRGIRARLFQSYIAIGTLIILIRLSLSRIDAVAFALGFGTFMFTLFAIAVISTFVYMNNFENGLAEDIMSVFRATNPGKPREPPPE